MSSPIPLPVTPIGRRIYRRARSLLGRTKAAQAAAYFEHDHRALAHLLAVERIGVQQWGSIVRDAHGGCCQCGHTLSARDTQAIDQHERQWCTVCWAGAGHGD